MSGKAWDSMCAAVGASCVARVADDRRPRGAPTDAIVVTPSDRAALTEVVQAALKDRIALIPIGTGRRARTPASNLPLVYVDLGQLNRIVAHEVGDLTMTVECGASLDSIARVAANHRQFVALDSAHAGATLGGTLATAEDGSLANRYGLVRDQVLGMAVVNGDGASTKSGGRVVKNVTGYDLVRLYTGSLGSLAIFVEATLRLRPLPESSVGLVLPMDSWQEASALSSNLRRSILDLTTLHVVAGRAAAACGLDADTPAWVRCGLSGFSQSVSATRSQIESLSRATWSDHAATEMGSFAVCAPDALRRIRVTATVGTWRTLDATLSPLLPSIVGRVQDMLRGTSEWWSEGQWHRAAQAAFDIQLGTAGARLELPDDPSFDSTLLTEWPSQVPEGVALMSRLKHALDPESILSPQTTLFE